MSLLERIFQDYFGLLIPFLMTMLLVAYVKRNRRGLITSVLLGQFNKVQFRAVQNNIEEKEMTILFCSCIFFQAIYIHSVYLEIINSIYLFYIFFPCLIGSKYIGLKLSGKLFQKEELFHEYKTSFFILVIILGLFSAPIAMTNIIYAQNDQYNLLPKLNITFIIAAIIFLLYRLVFIAYSARNEKISFLHIILYLCTLEILPIVIISYFIINY
jgi:hypothetical protein